MAPLNEKRRRLIGRVFVSAIISALVVLGGAETAERAWAEPLVVPGPDQTAGPDAIESGRVHMLEFGDRQTGAYYPTGKERAGNIVRAAAED